MELDFTGERIVPGAENCERSFAQKMYQEHIARYAFASELVEGRDVLDVACGVGYGSQWLAKSGAKSVLGIDIAEEAIDYARKNYFYPSVTYKVQDALTFEFEGEFDIVTCFEFIEHVSDQEKVLDGIKRALRPNGTLIISTPRPLEEKRTDFHVHELDFDDLQRMLLQRFPTVESFFERNCFTSFIGANPPDALDRIVRITDNLHLGEADYFIFIAGLSKKFEFKPPKPILAINDDSYVLRLEQDIVNLRNGENYHNQLIDEMSQRNDELLGELHSVQFDLEGVRKQNEGMELMQEEMKRIVVGIEEIRNDIRSSSEIASLKAELDSLRRSQEEFDTVKRDLKSIERVQDELVSAKAELGVVRRSRDGFARQMEQLVAENGRVRAVLSKVAQQLAETETRLNSQLAESDHLRRELSTMREVYAREMDVHTREMQELRASFEQSERTLNRFRRSVSWRMTRPLRWIGRQFRKIRARSVA